MLTIAICPNAFRGSLTAFEAAAAIESGLQDSCLNCQTHRMPLADGGDGTLAVWLHATGGQKQSTQVSNPAGETIQADFGIAGDVALVEMAQASGIELLSPEKRNPLHTTTYGTGQLIRAAVEQGARKILVGVGGSVTVDGGAGCLQALGARLLTADGQDIAPGGGHLKDLTQIDLSPALALLDGVTIQVLCDVDNPLLGENGAAPVFAPQKGASPEMANQLDNALTHYADIVESQTGIRLHELAHGGAAGGLGAGLSLVGAEMVSGIETLIHACGYDVQLQDVNLVITGEGKFDGQSGGGKAPLGILREATKHNIPVILLAGELAISPEALQAQGFAAGFSIVPGPVKLESALQKATEWLHNIAYTTGNLLALYRE